MLHSFLLAMTWTLATLLPSALLLHLFPRLGSPGRAIAKWFSHAPGLDFLITLFTAAPLIVTPILWGGWALPGAIVGQWATIIIWTILHELRHASLLSGPKLFRIHNKLVGTPRNLIALFVTSLAAPIFFLVRLTQYLVYPWMVWLVRLPRYDERQWINVSRHKFSGLVGHDRIWCLYCDWMTGVWSLGGEMLRNVETFWCPIRFLDPSKCSNCKTDFPDIENGWANEHGNIGTAAALLEQKFVTDAPSSNAWFGHPVRLTVKGKPTDTQA